MGNTHTIRRTDHAIQEARKYAVESLKHTVPLSPTKTYGKTY